MLGNSPAAEGPRPPTRVGARPRRAALGVLALALVGACSNGSADQTTPPVDLGMTSGLTPYYSDQQVTIYEVQKPVPLPVRAPSGDDLKALGPAPANTPYPHAPYLTVDDESLEVHYTISNLDSQQHTVWLLLDPWNEFVRWDPGVQVVSDEETVPNYGYDLPFIVPAMSRVQGTITPDDMHEIAIKLASVENLLSQVAPMPGQGMTMGDGGTPPNDPNANNNMPMGFDATSIANNIFNPLNRSNGGDPLYLPWIPPVIAGVTGFDLGLRTTDKNAAGNGPPELAVEITIDIQDLNGNRFVEAGSTNILGPPPKTLSPPAARF
jgi:hypothetical protein